MAFTLDTYAHVMPGMQPEAADLFRKLVFGSSQPREGRAGDPEMGDEEAVGDDESPENEESPEDQEEDQ